ncbi:MAG: hypothetical protein ACLQUY_20030 [Ktedonobacterales bacterium]
MPPSARLKETLDDLSAEQRRQILLDLHPLVYISRPDSDRPRVELVFSLTAEAAAHTRESSLWHTSNLSTRHGTYVTFVQQGWPPTPPDGTLSTVIDLGEDDSDDSEHPSTLCGDGLRHRVTPRARSG